MSNIDLQEENTTIKIELKKLIDDGRLSELLSSAPKETVGKILDAFYEKKLADYIASKRYEEIAKLESISELKGLLG